MIIQFAHDLTIFFWSNVIKMIVQRNGISVDWWQDCYVKEGDCRKIFLLYAPAHLMSNLNSRRRWSRHGLLKKKQQMGYSCPSFSRLPKYKRSLKYYFQKILVQL
ncbi:Uncharacterized protein APZ42_017379 [Daphnia magna]|uniref:Uncharacterized protein n=1 Tax=Daphnia magna TaxID=35525 RepID=A0A164ZTU2_9CRUS|nr:Uncharacterized protein APZ42_017379 [Daphnia magna]